MGTARTPQLVRLEVALAKAHYYDSATLEEQNTRHARLVEVETELRDLGRLGVRARMNPRRWFPKSRVAGWVGARFGWHRTSPIRFGPDGHLDPDWQWHYAGRKLLRAIREVRREP